ncbi:MAG TPA: hypothetical protein VF749_17950, partial [Candidatus Acidoferrum sp.]
AIPANTTTVPAAIQSLPLVISFLALRSIERSRRTSGGRLALSGFDTLDVDRLRSAVERTGYVHVLARELLRLGLVVEFVDRLGSGVKQDLLAAHRHARP